MNSQHLKKNDTVQYMKKSCPSIITPSSILRLMVACIFSACTYFVSTNLIEFNPYNPYNAWPVIRIYAGIFLLTSFAIKSTCTTKSIIANAMASCAILFISSMESAVHHSGNQDSFFLAFFVIIGATYVIYPILIIREIILLFSTSKAQVVFTLIFSTVIIPFLLWIITDDPSTTGNGEIARMLIPISVFIACAYLAYFSRKDLHLCESIK